MDRVIAEALSGSSPTAFACKSERHASVCQNQSCREAIPVRGRSAVLAKSNRSRVLTKLVLAHGWCGWRDHRRG
jgi:hypothetical protein